MARNLYIPSSLAAERGGPCAGSSPLSTRHGKSKRRVRPNLGTLVTLGLRPAATVCHPRHHLGSAMRPPPAARPSRTAPTGAAPPPPASGSAPREALLESAERWRDIAAMAADIVFETDA